MFEPVATGNWTLKADVSDDKDNEEQKRQVWTQRLGMPDEHHRHRDAAESDDPDDDTQRA